MDHVRRGQTISLGQSAEILTRGPGDGVEGIARFHGVVVALQAATFPLPIGLPGVQGFHRGRRLL